MSPRLVRSWQDAKDLRRKTGGELAGISRTGSPPCGWTLPSLPLLDHSHPRPFPLSPLEDDIPQAYPAQIGLARDSPTPGLTAGSPVRRAPLSNRYTSDEEGISTDITASGKSLHKRHGNRRSHGNWSGNDSNETLTSGGRQKKKDGFSSKIKIPKFGGKKGHPHDVANAFRQ